MITNVPLSVEDLKVIVEKANDTNSTKEDIKKCLYDVESAIVNFPEIGLLGMKILTTYQAVRFELIKLYENRFGEYKVQVKSTVTCEVVLRIGSSCHYIFADYKELKRRDIDFLNGRNSNKNIIRKLELIRDAEKAEVVGITDKDWYLSNRQKNYDRINELISDLKEIKQKNGKIKISTDFKYKIDIMELE